MRKRRGHLRLLLTDSFRPGYAIRAVRATLNQGITLGRWSRLAQFVDVSMCNPVLGLKAMPRLNCLNPRPDSGHTAVLFGKHGSRLPASPSSHLPPRGPAWGRGMFGQYQQQMALRKNLWHGILLT